MLAILESGMEQNKSFTSFTHKAEVFFFHIAIPIQYVVVRIMNNVKQWNTVVRIMNNFNQWLFVQIAVVYGVSIFSFAYLLKLKVYFDMRLF